MTPILVQDILHWKQKEKRKIVALTAYDFPFGKLVDQAGVDIALVGDSLGMVCLGYENTLPVTMEDMLHHTKAVVRAVKHALVVADMPYESYRTPQLAIRNAWRLIREGGAVAVKLEGGEKIFEPVQKLCHVGIPVMGHLGMTPQSIRELGGYKVQGKTKSEADKIFSDALELERLGVFSIVLECVPKDLAQRISKAVRIPTIGIGAGADTDGQILVLHDLLGFESPVRPRFVRRYADLNRTVLEAVLKYKEDVLSGTFPSASESFE